MPKKDMSRLERKSIYEYREKTEADVVRDRICDRGSCRAFGGSNAF